MTLKIYTLFSLAAGPGEGAFLAFAHSCKEARKVGWQQGGNDLTDQYIDLGANRLRDAEWLRDEANPQKLADDQAHVIWNPRSCSRCERWGQSPIGSDGLCEECRTDRIIQDEDLRDQRPQPRL